MRDKKIQVMYDLLLLFVPIEYFVVIVLSLILLKLFFEPTEAAD